MTFTNEITSDKMVGIQSLPSSSEIMTTDNRNVNKYVQSKRVQISVYESTELGAKNRSKNRKSIDKRFKGSAKRRRRDQNVNNE